MEARAGLAAAEEDRAGRRADLRGGGRNPVELLRRELAEERQIPEEVLDADGTGGRHRAMLGRGPRQNLDLR
jgi:hypothetical protein